MTIEIAGKTITSSLGIAISVAAIFVLLSAVFAYHRSTRFINREALVNEGKRWRRVSLMLVLISFLLAAYAFWAG